MKTTKNGQKIYETAKAHLGEDFSTDNNLGCAETVNAIVELALGYPVGGGASTALMYKALKTSTKFVQVSDPENGDIIISPTGTGNGGLEHGHVGIIGDGTVYANNSLSGKLQAGYYTVRTWRDYFGTIGGFPTLFYRAVDPVTTPDPKPTPTPVPTTIPTPKEEKTSYSANLANISQSTTNIIAIILVLSVVGLTYVGKIDSEFLKVILYAVFGVKAYRAIKSS